MPKVRGPLFSQSASGQFGRVIVFRKNGVVTRMHTPTNPNTPAQQAQRAFFKENYMAFLTKLAADLLYSALGHVHDDRYALLEHDHDGIYSASDHLHDERYMQIPGAAVWTAPTLLNSWVNIGTPYAPIGYYKDAFGVVRLRGIVTSGVIGQSIFVLPEGCRPGYDEVRVTVSNYVLGRCLITTAGAVQAVSGSNIWFSIDGLSFTV